MRVPVGGDVRQARIRSMRESPTISGGRKHSPGDRSSPRPRRTRLAAGGRDLFAWKQRPVTWRQVELREQRAADIKSTAVSGSSIRPKRSRQTLRNSHPLGDLLVADEHAESQTPRLDILPKKHTVFKRAGARSWSPFERFSRDEKISPLSPREAWRGQ